MYDKLNYYEQNEGFSKGSESVRLENITGNNLVLSITRVTDEIAHSEVLKSRVKVFGSWNYDVKSAEFDSRTDYVMITFLGIIKSYYLLMEVITFNEDDSVIAILWLHKKFIYHVRC